MRKFLRVIATWSARSLVMLMVILVLDVAILAFPQPLFAHKHRLGEFTIYSNEPLPERLEDVAEDTRARILAMENPRPDVEYRVFVCHSQGLYSVFAFLTRKTSDSLGIGLSVLGHMYLNEGKIRRFAAYNPLGIRHSRFEGNLAGVIAHEIAHFNVVRQLGYRASMNMPFWKSEGYAEYQANLAATRADESYDFEGRIDLLLDDSAWGSSRVARYLFEQHLLVEFLAEVKGLGLEQLVDPAVSEASARQEMLEWYREQCRQGREEVGQDEGAG